MWEESGVLRPVCRRRRRREFCVILSNPSRRTSATLLAANATRRTQTKNQAELAYAHVCKCLGREERLHTTRANERAEKKNSHTLTHTPTRVNIQSTPTDRIRCTISQPSTNGRGLGRRLRRPLCGGCARRDRSQCARCDQIIRFSRATYGHGEPRAR